MPGTKDRRPAFTLTEVLMAVGILGVGLTMVASIFPVAVDQSRRSREITQAALCARSASAMIRVLRNNIKTWRKNAGGGSVQEEIWGLLPEKLKVYDPTEFLYDHEDENGNPNRSYDSTDVWGDEGSKANYVPRIFVTPIAEGGPWRITLAIYRSHGKAPPTYVALEGWPRLWSKMGPGKYVLDGDNWCGYAYMVDSIKEGPDLKDHPEYATLATLGRYQQKNLISWWRCLVGRDAESPDAVAVYHTILGD